MQNPFSLFGLSIEFDLDSTALNQQYLRLQRIHHPDNYATATQNEQLAAMQQTASINDAYQTLTDPIRRAEAILCLAQQAEPELEKTVRDENFLIQQLTLREELESIGNKKDTAALDVLREKNELLWQEHIQTTQSAVAQKDWEKLKQVIDRLKFIRKLRNEIDQLEELFYD